MTIVITGATGPYGRAVVRELIANGQPAQNILATGRNRARLDDLAGLGVRTALVDFSDPDSFGPAFQGATAVLVVSTADLGNQVPQHTNAIRAAQAAGVGHIAYSSALRADTTPLILAAEHAATETVIRDSGIPFTFLRNGWYTDNFVTAFRNASVSGVFLTSVGDGRIAPATRADLAAAAAIVLAEPRHDGKIYELAGDTSLSYADIATTFSRIAGHDISLQNLTSDEHQKTLKDAGLDEATVGFLVTIDSNIRAGALDSSDPQLSHLLHRPTTSFEQGLRSALADTA